MGGAGTGGTGTGGTVAAACTGTPPASLAAGSVCPSPACRACEAANCDPTLSGCGSLPTGSSNRSVCDALELCIRLAHCTVNGSESPCYCGTATQLQCPAGLGINGPCKAQFEAADPNVVALGPSATDAQKAAVLTVDLTNPALAVGLVGNLVNCDTGVCYTANACGGQF